MDNLENCIRLFDTHELEVLHHGSLEILKDPGMKIMSPALLQALEKEGAQVDSVQQIVHFPAWLVEKTIHEMQAEIHAGRKPLILNGVVSSQSRGKIQGKFGGACIEYFDWERGELRTPARQDLINLVRLGQALPEITTVGNPVVYLSEDDGSPVDPRLQRVKTAALVACYTTKAGATEVWNALELEFLMEIGQVVRGSRQAYLENPCFVTAKETISPLVLNEEAGDVLLLLAQHNLPTTIIPMPLTGGSSPMSLAASVMLCNAEILGVATALRCACPTAWIAGGIISGVIDMKTGAACFAAPEAILQDLAVAELYERYYGFDFAIGTGYTDAKYPGTQSVMEKLARFWASYRSGRVNYPVGLVNQGKAFSPEQALLDIETARYIHEFEKGLKVDQESLCIDLIRQQGIGGNFFREEHTVRQMRKTVWYPTLMDRALSQGLEKDSERDILAQASNQYRKIMASADYEIEVEKRREIDRILLSARRALVDN